MLGSKKLTAFLFVVLIVTVISSTLALNKQDQPGQSVNKQSNLNLFIQE